MVRGGWEGGTHPLGHLATVRVMVVVLQHDHCHYHREAHDDHGAGKILGCGETDTQGESEARYHKHHRAHFLTIRAWGAEMPDLCGPFLHPTPCLGMRAWSSSLG